MAPKGQDTVEAIIGQTDFQELLQEKLRLAVRYTLHQVLEEEVTAFIGASRYQRGAGRRDQRNGYYERDLETGVGRIEKLAVPRTRKGFRTQVFKRYQRRQTQLDQAISEMFVSGSSTRQVGEILETLTGTKPSPSTVSRVYHNLEAEFTAWKQRKLAADYAYVFSDGTYFSVIYEGQGHKSPILAVVGITRTGQREVLGFRIGDRENQAAWEELLADLKRRGLQTVGLWISDGHQAMLNAIATHFPDTARQRCIKHKMDNVLSSVPKKQRDPVRAELRAIFYQDSRVKADQEVLAFCEKFQADYPTAVECLKRDLDACLTFYAFPKTHWKTIRTTNIIERLFVEVKKRTRKMAAPFRNENSCLLLFYAVVRSLKFQRLRMPAKPDTGSL